MKTSEMYSVLDQAQSESAFSKALDSLLKPQQPAKKTAPDLYGKMKVALANEYLRTVSMDRRKQIFRWIAKLDQTRPMPTGKAPAEIPVALPMTDEQAFYQLGNIVTPQQHRQLVADARTDPRASRVLNHLLENFRIDICEMNGLRYIRKEKMEAPESLEDFLGTLEALGQRAI
jgi:hypothetical protein